MSESGFEGCRFELCRAYTTRLARRLPCRSRCISVGRNEKTRYSYRSNSTFCVAWITPPASRRTRYIPLARRPPSSTASWRPAATSPSSSVAISRPRISTTVSRTCPASGTTNGTTARGLNGFGYVGRSMYSCGRPSGESGSLATTKSFVVIKRMTVPSGGVVPSPARSAYTVRPMG